MNDLQTVTESVAAIVEGVRAIEEMLPKPEKS